MNSFCICLTASQTLVLTPMKAAAGKEITTIEGLSNDNSHPLQKAWMAEDVPQCGYCQSGQIMSAAILLKQNKKPTDTDIDHAIRPRRRSHFPLRPTVC